MNSSNSSTARTEGNTKQSSPAKHFCFTLHRPSKEDIIELNQLSSKYKLFSMEYGKSGETPHLQGLISFAKKCRPFGLHSNKTIHWEAAIGSLQQNIKYIKKEFNEYWENGILKEPIKLIKVLYPWQEDILNIVISEGNDRTINWIYDPDGCKGKSALVKYLCCKHEALILSSKTADMKYGIVKYMEKHNKGPEIILIDIPRSVDLDYFSYAGTEAVKDGCFFSSKYECDMVIYNSPHVVIFSNSPPDLYKMTGDRWNVIEL